jgi:outer membrane receptor protein involved in Fe transport
MNDLLVGMYTPAGLFQFQNAERVRASGVEVELNGHPVRWLELATALSQQRAVNLAHDYPLANSPGPVAKLRLAVPLLSSRFSLAGAAQYRGPRQTPDGATLPSVWLSDVTVSSNRLPSNLEFQAGVRNIANRKYFDPVALDARFDTLPVPGRSMFVSLTWRKAGQ